MVTAFKQFTPEAHPCLNGRETNVKDMKNESNNDFL